MDDLISRSQMSEAIKDYLKGLIDKGIHEVDITEFNVDVQSIIEAQPTAYNVDKVVEQLQEMYEYCGTSNCADCKYDGKCEPELVFDIVKAGGVNG